MMDGEDWSCLIVSIGILIIGIGAFFLTIIQNEDFIMLCGFGIAVVFLGIVLHMFTEFHYEYKKWRTKKWN